MLLYNIREVFNSSFNTCMTNATFNLEKNKLLMAKDADLTGKNKDLLQSLIAYYKETTLNFEKMSTLLYREYQATGCRIYFELPVILMGGRLRFQAAIDAAANVSSDSDD